MGSAFWFLALSLIKWKGVDEPKVGEPKGWWTENQNLYFASDIINFGYVRLKDVQKVLFSPSWSIMTDYNDFIVNQKSKFVGSSYFRFINPLSINVIDINKALLLTGTRSD